MDGFTIAIIILVIVVLILIVTFFVLPKVKRNKLSDSMDMAKSMLEDNKEDIKDLYKTGLELKKEILEENEDALKKLEEKTADIESVVIEKKAAAVKKGLTETKICQHCGAKIDIDSIFCKECGKKQ